MPQLVKGGKYVFGWSTINNELNVRMPDEAYDIACIRGVAPIMVYSSGSAPSSSIFFTSSRLLLPMAIIHLSGVS